MRVIVADENIPFVQEAFSFLGSVETHPAAALSAERLQHADVLLVRSTVRVDAALLAGTPVQFVGSATIGTDHIDTEFLAGSGIRFAHAPGSNADSVVEYVMTALLTLCMERRVAIESLAVGVVGCGHIGGRLMRRLPALGCRVSACDPPLAREAERARLDHPYVSLDTVLSGADVVTLHVPLTRTGPDATHHLLNAERFSRMRPGAWLVNTSRGSVVRGDALWERLSSGEVGGAVLDVWEREPTPDVRLVEAVSIGTPHIAGYSYDGKVAGTLALVRAASAHFDVAVGWTADHALHEIAEDALDLRALSGAVGRAEWLAHLATQAYPIRRDAEEMSRYGAMDPALRAAFFADLRKRYPRRRAFALHRLDGAGLTESQRRAAADGLGFRIV